MKQQFLLGTLTTLLCLFQITNLETVFAQGMPQQDNTEQIDISLTDIIGSNQLVRLVPNEQFPGGQLLDTVAKPTINTQVTKTINNLWKMGVTPGTSENDLTVQYELDSLNHLTVSNSKIIVRQIDSVNLRTITDAIETTVVTDDVKFTFDLSGIKASGTYSGDLRITVTQI
jgi:hypothetical protein